MQWTYIQRTHTASGAFPEPRRTSFGSGASGQQHQRTRLCPLVPMLSRSSSSIFISVVANFAMLPALTVLACDVRAEKAFNRLSIWPCTRQRRRERWIWRRFCCGFCRFLTISLSKSEASRLRTADRLGPRPTRQGHDRHDGADAEETIGFCCATANGECIEWRRFDLGVATIVIGLIIPDEHLCDT